MMSPDELRHNLAHFSGTETWYRYLGGLLLTDGAKYLADNARCYWLFDIIASVLPTVGPKADGMFFVTLTVQGTSGEVVVDRDEDEELYRQSISYTDFPLHEQKLFVVLDGAFEAWVAMLPGEY